MSSDRPYLNLSTQELERLRLKNSDRQDVLARLNYELLHRTTKRAHDLRAKVARDLVAIAERQGPWEWKKR